MMSKVRLDEDEAELLVGLSDEAHNDATGRLFEWCGKLRDLKAEHPELLMEELISNLETREILHLMAWTGTVFDAMELTDRLKRSLKKPD